MDEPSKNQVVAAQKVEGHLGPMGDEGDVQGGLQCAGVCPGSFVSPWRAPTCRGSAAGGRRSVRPQGRSG